MPRSQPVVSTRGVLILELDQAQVAERGMTPAVPAMADVVALLDGGALQRSLSNSISSAHRPTIRSSAAILAHPEVKSVESRDTFARWPERVARAEQDTVACIAAHVMRPTPWGSG
jgi:hypothetical protein